jgi:hypothetical protein
MDLTADRQYAEGLRRIGYHEQFDLIEAPQSQYQMSLQAGMWNRELLLELLSSLRPENRNPWDVELVGTGIINRADHLMQVRGTLQCPVRYANALNNASGKKVFYDNLIPDDVAYIRDTIPEDYK